MIALNNVARIPFIRELNRMGFVRENFTDVVDPMVYSKLSRGKLIIVRLWIQGRHGVGHSLGGVEDSRWTQFDTIEEMRAAVAEREKR